jgi:hypothetical protein
MQRRLYGETELPDHTSSLVFVQETIFAFEHIFINGGKRGFLVEINPADLPNSYVVDTGLFYTRPLSSFTRWSRRPGIERNMVIAAFRGFTHSDRPVPDQFKPSIMSDTPQHTSTRTRRHHE